MKKIKDINETVVLVTNYNDWEALYVNGVSVCQSHIISRKLLVEECLKAKEQFLTVEAYSEKLDLEGQFPDKLSELEDFCDDINF